MLENSQQVVFIQGLDSAGTKSHLISFLEGSYQLAPSFFGASPSPQGSGQSCPVLIGEVLILERERSLTHIFHSVDFVVEEVDKHNRTMVS